MEELKNALSMTTFGMRYNELEMEDQECVDQRANDLCENFEDQIHNTWHVMTRARFEGI